MVVLWSLKVERYRDLKIQSSHLNSSTCKVKKKKKPSKLRKIKKNLQGIIVKRAVLTFVHAGHVRREKKGRAGKITYQRSLFI